MGVWGLRGWTSEVAVEWWGIVGVVAVGESRGGLGCVGLGGLLHAFFGRHLLVCFIAFSGRNGRQWRCTVVMCQVAPAHDVGCPDESVRIECDVFLGFPGLDAVLEVGVIKPQCIRLGDRISDKSSQGFQGGNNIIGGHACPVGEVDYAEGLTLLEQLVGEYQLPVVAVGDQAHVRQWLFGRASLAFDTSEEVGEADEEVAISLSLMSRQSEDTRNIILTAGSLLLGEVSNKMTAELVIFGHDIEEKWLNIVIQRLGSQEQFGKKTKILAVYRILPSIDLEDGNGFVAVYFIAWRMLGGTFELVPPGNVVGVHVLEAEFADVEHSIPAVLFRVGCGIPCLDLVPTEVDALDLTRWTRHFLTSARILILPF